MYESTTADEAEDYSDVSVQHQEKVFQDLISFVNIQPGFKCLDIGCGVGNNTATLAGLVGSKGHVIGIDPDDERIQLAKKKYGHLENIEFISGKGGEFPPDYYDLIVTNVVMHWIPFEEKIEIYKKVFQNLKPGGVFANAETSKREGEVFRFEPFLPKDACLTSSGEKAMQIYFVSLEKNKEILSEIGFEFVSMCEVVHRNNIHSLEGYFKWLDSTLHGKVDSKSIYAEHKNDIKLEINSDGSVVHEIHHNRIIVRKPIG